MGKRREKRAKLTGPCKCFIEGEWVLFTGGPFSALTAIGDSEDRAQGATVRLNERHDKITVRYPPEPMRRHVKPRNRPLVYEYPLYPVVAASVVAAQEPVPDLDERLDQVLKLWAEGRLCEEVAR